VLLLTARPKHRIGRALFLLKNRFFDPRTAKSQLIWIKFCTHLLLYGIHLWADLDSDRRMGSSKPNQNDCFFVILVTHLKSYIRDDGSPRFRQQSVKVEVRTVDREKFRNFVRGESQIQKQHFSRISPTLQLSCAQPTWNSFTTNQWYRWKVWWCAFCKSRKSVTRHLADIGLWRVPKSGHVTITKN